MRIGIFSDVHANLPALEAVLKALTGAQVDTLYCLGDTVGYGPFPNECVDLVRQHCAVVLKGNHDSGLINETPIEDFNQYGLAAIQWSQEHVTDDRQEFLRNLPLMEVKNDVTLAHASPLQPAEWMYVLTLRAARENFTAFSTRLCFIGHTHVPVIINEDLTVDSILKPGRSIINVGSVGQPRDGNPDAAYGIFDAETGEYKLHRVQYDVKKTASAIKKAGLPDYLAKRLYQGV
jgi:diadenosine tetraphosphatase ApaH/serine/threonine PP2A family protein phosphatase